MTYWYTRWRRILASPSASSPSPTFRPSAAELIREARLYLAGYAMIVGVSLMAHSGGGVFWLAPMLAMAGHQPQNTMEHLGLPHEDNVLVNTRSTRTNAVMRWLGWQMQYHTAHHAFPGVPFHRLRTQCGDIHERGAQPPR